MNTGFVENLKILDEWESGCIKYRIVDLGFGPDQLQVLDGGEWRKERSCYEWGIIIDRLLELKDMDNG